MLNAKHQAFVEMDSIESSSKLLGAYGTQQPSIRGSSIGFQFSTRQTVTANPRYPSSGQQQSGSFFGGDSKDPAPNVILLVTIVNNRLPVSLDNLYTVFRAYGDVLRIVTFEKGAFKAFIEYAHVSSAINAKRQLEGKDMFQGCCTLQISFSSAKAPLVVKMENHRAHDFSLGPLNPGGYQGYGAQSAPPYGGNQGYGGQNFGGYGNPSPSGGFGGPPQGGYGSDRFGGGQQPYSPYGPPPDQYRAGPQHGCVLLVNKLPTENVTTDILFTLFGVYGNVMRVKILYNKKDTAFVQFQTVEQATTARQYLDKVELFGQTIYVSTSRNKEVSLPPLNSKFEPSQLTKDYSDSKLHRFRMPNSKNAKHVCAPSSSLHISGLPEGTTDEQLESFFSEQVTIEGAKMFENNSRMGFVHFASIADAISALLLFHNAKFGGRLIKATFSHSNGAARGGMQTNSM
jgi:hnRNP-L/PTB/hephaestus splicing factor